MTFQMFKPDAAFSDIYAITPEVLDELGIKGIVFDIDQTVAPYEVALPTEEMKAYFETLRAAGIKMAFVSNNIGPRVKKFNESIGLFYVCRAGKPSPKGVKVCIDHFGLKQEEILSIGDQIFTDCLSAHRAGIRFAMVQPIKKQENLFFRIKRFFERPFVKELEWLDSGNALIKLRKKKLKETE